MEVSGFLLLISTVFLHNVSCCSIINVNISASSDSAVITWETSEDCSKVNIVQYNVTWIHVKYLACQGRRQFDNQSFESSLGPSEKHIIEHKLWSYSLYEVFIGAKSSNNYYSVETVSQTFETKPSAPDFDVSSDNRLKTDRFGQALRFHWNKTDCRVQNGRFMDYLVEFEGLDPWALGPIALPTNTTPSEFIYVQNLLPYTSYMLRVYSRNHGNLVNRVPLDIEAKTLEDTPKPPTKINLKIISSSSVHLAWDPSYPPTGQLEMFEISYRHDTRPWYAPVEVGLSHSQACVKKHKLIKRSTGDSDGETYCYVFDNLNENTNYGFRIRSRNVGVEESSDWSDIVNVTTGGAPDTIDNITETATDVTDKISTITPATTPTQPVSSSNSSQTNASNSSRGPNNNNTKTIVIIVGICIGIVFLGVCVTALIYKLKIARLKQQMRNEELWNQNRDLDISRSVSYVGGSSVNTRLSDLSAYAEISVPSLNNSFNMEIQSRRLPEPPPVRNRAQNMSEPEYCDTYELENLPRNGYLDMSPSRRPSPAQQLVLDSSKIQEEDTIDTDDCYLKPTFPNTDLTPVRLPGHEEPVYSEGHYVAENKKDDEIITPESYEAPETLRNNPPDLVIHNLSHSPKSSFNSLSNFDRFEGPRLSENSVDSSKRNSPSEPLIKSVTVSTPVDV